MNNKSLIIGIILLMGLAAIGYMILQNKKKKQKTTNNEDTIENVPPSTITQIQIKAEGENFSTLYGWSNILDKVPNILDSTSNLVEKIKQHKKNKKNQNNEQFCNINL